MLIWDSCSYVNTAFLNGAEDGKTAPRDHRRSPGLGSGVSNQTQVIRGAISTMTDVDYLPLPRLRRRDYFPRRSLGVTLMTRSLLKMLRW